jgi:hypothetical protein
MIWRVIGSWPDKEVLEGAAMRDGAVGQRLGIIHERRMLSSAARRCPHRLHVTVLRVRVRVCEVRFDKIKEAVRYLAYAAKEFSERQDGARWGRQLESRSRPILIIEKRQVSRIEP